MTRKKGQCQFGAGFQVNGSERIRDGEGVNHFKKHVRNRGTRKVELAREI